ncbi:MAG: hypothetical protein HOM08_13125 [Candidatus Marinimicrobia bacterium]|jgi:hypothetical protein|nr:hypothetical protein [Candidatus Neomarinimicrobiota bacterium]
MGSYSHYETCPNCGYEEMTCWGETGRIPVSGSECRNCGLLSYTKVTQLDLGTLNSMREQHNEENEYEEGDKDYFCQRDELPTIQESLIEWYGIK